MSKEKAARLITSLVAPRASHPSVWHLLY